MYNHLEALLYSNPAHSWTTEAIQTAQATTSRRVEEYVKVLDASINDMDKFTLVWDTETSLGCAIFDLEESSELIVIFETENVEHVYWGKQLMLRLALHYQSDIPSVVMADLWLYKHASEWVYSGLFTQYTPSVLPNPTLARYRIWCCSGSGEVVGSRYNAGSDRSGIRDIIFYYVRDVIYIIAVG